MIDKLAEAYLQLRDKVAELEKAHKVRLKPLKEKLERIENAVLAEFERTGVKNARTPSGTFYLIESHSVTTADKLAFETWLRETGSWEVADIRPMKSAIVAMVETGEVPPPGVNFSARMDVGFRRASE